MMFRDSESGGDVAAIEESPSARARGKKAQANWRVLAYLAGDNNLESALLENLRDMERVGSRPGSVEVLAQVDRPGARGGAQGLSALAVLTAGDWTGTRRYYVTASPHPEIVSSKLLAELGETNTGDPRVLEDFVAFGAKRYPARATLLVLSNHGSGFYVPPEMLSGGKRRRAPAHAARSFFRTTHARLLDADQARGILYDDGAADCLDNRELKAVLAHAHKTLGRPVDVVGMDACLMTMLEVAYQMRDHARILVGSEEVEPGAGWPWAQVLGDLTSRPAMAAPELAGAIVNRYAEAYASDGSDATQSAIDLAKLDDVVGAVDQLARALLAALPGASLELALYMAWRRTLRFFDGLYVDLHDFAANLGRATGLRDVRRACIEIQGALEAERSPILAERHDGPRMAKARGLSIYFPPFRDPSIFYRELDFARRTRWAEFLDAYLGSAKTVESR